MKNMSLTNLKENLILKGNEKEIVEKFINRMKQNKIKEAVELTEEEYTIAEEMFDFTFEAYLEDGETQITPTEILEYSQSIQGLDLAPIMDKVLPVTLKTIEDPNHVSEDKFLFNGFRKYLFANIEK